MRFYCKHSQLIMYWNRLENNQPMTISSDKTTLNCKIDHVSLLHYKRTNNNLTWFALKKTTIDCVHELTMTRQTNCTSIIFALYHLTLYNLSQKILTVRHFGICEYTSYSSSSSPDVVLPSIIHARHFISVVWIVFKLWIIFVKTRKEKYSLIRSVLVL